MTLESLIWILLIWLAIQIPAAIVLGRFIATGGVGAARSPRPENVSSTTPRGDARYEPARTTSHARSRPRRIISTNS
jgi:hypothetical protein